MAVSGRGSAEMPVGHVAGLFAKKCARGGLVGVGEGEQAVEAGVVRGLREVRELVRDDVVEAGRRVGRQTGVHADASGRRRAGPPACLLYTSRCV